MNYLYILLGVTVIFFVYVYVKEWATPELADISYINMDKDTDRRAFMEKQLNAVNVPYRRWPGVDGSTLTTEDMKRNHVGSPSFAIRHKSWDGKMRNTGVIGCWLAHKTLLEHLATLPVHDNYAHLIIEDDIHIPSTLKKSKWEQDLPRDWDMLYFGITQPVIDKQITPKLAKLKPGNGNWGTYAYAVRHGSIRTKILPCLTWFHDPIDNQYDMCFSEWNTYALTPNMLTADSEFQEKSSIDKSL